MLNYKLFEMKIKKNPVHPYGEENWAAELPPEAPARERRGVFDDKIHEVEPGTKMYILREIEYGLYLYKPNQWRNILTDDPRKAKTYTSVGMAIKSVTHSIESRKRLERGKWELVEVKSINLGEEQPLEF